MFLLELVMQGVRGFKELARLRFQPGFNFIAAGNEAGKTASVDAMVGLLFPGSEAGRAASLISRETPDASRAALVVCADDGAYYRIIQDLSKQAVNLSKYNASTKDFALLHKDREATVQFMAGLTTGMSEEDYSRLFVLRRDHYAGQAVMNSSAPAPALQVARIKSPSGPSGKAAAQDAKLAELRETLRKAEEAADADYRLESAKLRLGEIVKKLEGLEEINGRYADIHANLALLKGCESLPENLDELMDVHEQSQGQKMVKSEELQQDIEALKMQRQGMPKASLLTDSLFILGIFSGIGSLAAGVFFPAVLPEAELATYFPIGILVSLVLVSAAWYKSSRKNAQKDLVQKEVEGLEAEREELEKSIGESGGAIVAYMQATASSTTAELKDKAENYKRISSLIGEINEQRQRLLGGTAVEALRAEYGQLQEEVIGLEKAARAVSQYAVDTYSIRQEIERIESESAGPSWDFSSPDADAPADFGVPAAPRSGHGATFLPELTIASRIGEIEMDTLVPAVEAAAQRNLSAVTMGKYVRVEAGPDGGPAVYDKKDMRMGYAELSHSTRETLYFCLRTGLIEALAGKIRLPLVLDDPLAGFDPARQHAACQVLRALGTKTQVILFTSNPALKAQGDVVLELK
jgi:DNA repair exonuclease SbcCD ATPase subunit